MGELPSAKPIRVGLIGLDTSHVLAFPELLRQPDAPAELATMAIVAGYPGGNPDFPLSRDRVADYTRHLQGPGDNAP